MIKIKKICTMSLFLLASCRNILGVRYTQNHQQQRYQPSVNYGPPQQNGYPVYPYQQQSSPTTHLDMIKKEKEKMIYAAQKSSSINASQKASIISEINRANYNKIILDSIKSKMRNMYRINI